MTLERIYDHAEQIAGWLFPFGICCIVVGLLIMYKAGASNG